MEHLTRLNGNWNEIKERLRQNIAIHKDSDLLLVPGKQEEMLGRLKSNLRKTKEKVYKLISEK